MTETGAVLRVSVNKSIEIYLNSSNMLKFGEKVVNSFLKKLGCPMFLKIKMFYKFIKVKQKDKSRKRNLKTMIKIMELRKMSRRKRNDIFNLSILLILFQKSRLFLS
jgi:hypothetical protein